MFVHAVTTCMRAHGVHRMQALACETWRDSWLHCASGPPSCCCPAGALARVSVELRLPNTLRMRWLAGLAGLPAGALHIACRWRQALA